MPTIWPEADRKTAPGIVVTGPLADAPPANWVDRFAPRNLKPWLRLIRADRLIGVWLLLWPCWWSVALSARLDEDLPDPTLLLLFAIGAFAMRSAGCIYNDIIDRDVDASVARTQGRPLANGQISLRSAIALALVLCLAGLAVLLQFNAFAIALGFGSLGIVLIYPLMKRVTFWPQAVLGLAFAWGALMGWAAVFGWLALAPMVLYLAAVAWTIGYDTIYALQDKDDDLVIGLKSTALRFGRNTASWLCLFYGIALGGIAFSGWLVGTGIWFFAGLAAAAAQLIWQVATLDPDDPRNCLDRFRSNNGFGAIVFAAIVIDAIAVAIS
jgi:4-hydroxybenzoate polyprenyltransferase